MKRAPSDKARIARLEEVLSQISINAQCALTGATFDLPRCIRLCNLALQGDESTWPFAPLTGPQLAQREGFEQALRAGEVRVAHRARKSLGLPTDFGALA